MKEKISNLSLFTLLFLTTTATTLMLGISNYVGTSSFLAVPIGAIPALPLYLMIARVHRLYPEKSLGQLLEHLYGRGGTRVICLIYTLFALFTGAILTGYLTRFISFTGENQQVAAVFSVFFLISCYLGARVRLGATARLSRLLFPTAAVILLLSLLLCLIKFDPDAIRPLFDRSVHDLAVAGGSLLLFPFCQVILILPFVFRSKSAKVAKPLLWALGISSAVITLAYLGTAGVLGGASMDKLNYPYYMALSVLDVTSFFQRIEVILSIHFVLAMLIKGIACIIFSCRAAAHTFQQPQARLLAAPMAALTLALSLILFSTTEEMFDLMNLYPFLMAPFVLVFPIVTYFVAEIKRR